MRGQPLRDSSHGKEGVISEGARVLAEHGRRDFTGSGGGGGQGRRWCLGPVSRNQEGRSGQAMAERPSTLEDLAPTKHLMTD